MKILGDKLTNWADVESAIATAVAGDTNRASLIDDMLDLQNREGCPRTAYAEGRRDLDGLLRMVEVACGSDNLDRETVINCFLKKLTEYEESFVDYLDREVGSKRSYDERAKRLFAWLRDDGVPSQNKCRLYTTVLSFNYTDPLGSSDNNYGVVHYNNIHGSLNDNNAIFGIDGFAHPGLLELPFTKTYRLLSQENEVSGVVYSKDNEAFGKTEVIKFYGHSLAEADYSYFQALFDAVDLYGSDIRLTFYYSVYDDGEDAATRGVRIKERECMRVAKLLRRYGETLDNKDHGRNLMHKLLLEGRLGIAVAGWKGGGFEQDWQRPI